MSHSLAGAQVQIRDLALAEPRQPGTGKLQQRRPANIQRQVGQPLVNQKTLDLLLIYKASLLLEVGDGTVAGGGSSATSGWAS